ncbi:MAG TPA: 3-deoxy-manno-octulosonate cytidylyltransferase [Bacteroidales bacterium]
MNIVGIIPARFASTRFPGKPLAMIHGKTMIQRVVEQAKQANLLSKVLVATDDERIFEHVQSFGGEVVMTSVNHENGTSRCEEAISILEKELPGGKIEAVINIQGDEPFINPEQINSVARLLLKAEIATLVKIISNKEEIFNPNVVKVVVTADNRALYFSRQAIPYLRDIPQNEWFSRTEFFKHIGIYGFRRNILKEITYLKPGKLEVQEKLEQLRWLEAGYNIYTEKTDFEGVAVDTQEDLLKLTNKAC